MGSTNLLRAFDKSTRKELDLILSFVVFLQCTEERIFL